MCSSAKVLGHCRIIHFPKNLLYEVPQCSSNYSTCTRLSFEMIVCNITFQMSGDPGISAFPDGDNLFKWIATLHGPKDTVR